MRHPMRHPTQLALSVAFTLFGILPAHADVPPPETQPCTGKQAGTACTYQSKAGTCQNGTCSKLDYLSWDRDASASPPTTSYACVKCETAAATGTLTTTATVTATVTDTTTVTDTATTSQTATTTLTPTATPTDTATTTTTDTATASTTDTDTLTSTVTATMTTTTTVTSTQPTDTSTTTPPPLETKTATSTPSGTSTGTSQEPDDDDDDDGACSIGRAATAKRVAPWLLAASFSLLFLFARRRR